MRIGIKMVAVDELDVNSVVRAPINTSMNRNRTWGISLKTWSELMIFDKSYTCVINILRIRNVVVSVCECVRECVCARACVCVCETD